MSIKPEHAKKMIPALLREREGYKQSGKEDRVKQVDEQLKLYGYSKSEEFRKAPPVGRSERPHQTGSDK